MRKSFLLHTHGDCKSMMKEEEIQIRNLLKFAGVQFRPVFLNLQQTIPWTSEICFTIEARECVKVFVSCICCLLQFRHSLIRIPTCTLGYPKLGAEGKFFLKSQLVTFFYCKIKF